MGYSSLYMRIVT